MSYFPTPSLGEGQFKIQAQLDEAFPPLEVSLLSQLVQLRPFEPLRFMLGDLSTEHGLKGSFQLINVVQCSNPGV